MDEWQQEEFDGEFGYLIRFKAESHSAEFVVYEIVAHDGDDGTACFEVADGSGDEWTDDLEEAEVFLSGFIKWDGCSNWDFKTDACMKHFCGRDDANGLGRLMDRMYALAEEHMPRYNKEIAS